MYFDDSSEGASYIDEEEGEFVSEEEGEEEEDEEDGWGSTDFLENNDVSRPLDYFSQRTSYKLYSDSNDSRQIDSSWLEEEGEVVDTDGLDTERVDRLVSGARQSSEGRQGDSSGRKSKALSHILSSSKRRSTKKSLESAKRSVRASQVSQPKSKTDLLDGKTASETGGSRSPSEDGFHVTPAMLTQPWERPSYEHVDTRHRAIEDQPVFPGALTISPSMATRDSLMSMLFPEGPKEKEEVDIFKTVLYIPPPWSEISGYKDLRLQFRRSSMLSQKRRPTKTFEKKVLAQPPGVIQPRQSRESYFISRASDALPGPPPPIVTVKPEEEEGVLLTPPSNVDMESSAITPHSHSDTNFSWADSNNGDGVRASIHIPALNLEVLQTAQGGSQLSPLGRIAESRKMLMAEPEEPIIRLVGTPGFTRGIKITSGTRENRPQDTTTQRSAMHTPLWHSLSGGRPPDTPLKDKLTVLADVHAKRVTEKKSSSRDIKISLQNDCTELIKEHVVPYSTPGLRPPVCPETRAREDKEHVVPYSIPGLKPPACPETMAREDKERAAPYSMQGLRPPARPGDSRPESRVGQLSKCLRHGESPREAKAKDISNRAFSLSPNRDEPSYSQLHQLRSASVDGSPPGRTRSPEEVAIQRHIARQAEARERRCLNELCPLPEPTQLMTTIQMKNQMKNQLEGSHGAESCRKRVANQRHEEIIALKEECAFYEVALRDAPAADWLLRRKKEVYSTMRRQGLLASFPPGKTAAEEIGRRDQIILCLKQVWSEELEKRHVAESLLQDIKLALQQGV